MGKSQLLKYAAMVSHLITVIRVIRVSALCFLTLIKYAAMVITL